MGYVRSVFYNFLGVFLANQLLPGIEVTKQTKLPYLGIDLIFALALGLAMSFIYPVFKSIFRRVNVFRIVLASLILPLAAYAIIKFVPLGIEVSIPKGYLFGALTVALVGFLTNYFGMKKPIRFHSPLPSSDD